MKQRYHVEYGERGGYVVRETDTREVVFASDSKIECIAESQRRHGWFVNGSEVTYHQQRKANCRGRA